MTRAGDRSVLAWVAAAAALGAPCAPAAAQRVDRAPAAIAGEGVEERRGATAPLDLPLLDSRGREVRLGDFFDGERPVVLMLVYYDCPMLCNMMMADMNRLLKSLPLTLGRDYRVVALSFDHTNTVIQAAEKRAAFTQGLEGGDEHWAFLLGGAQEVKAAAESVGFTYRYIESSKEFAHPSVFFVLSPSGVISNYVYGRPDKQFDAKQAALALQDAADGKIGSLFDRVVFWCYHWDSSEGVYSLQAFRVMQVGAGITALGVATFVGAMFLTGKRRGRRPGDRGEAPQGVEHV